MSFTVSAGMTARGSPYGIFSPLLIKFFFFFFCHFSLCYVRVADPRAFHQIGPAVTLARRTLSRTHRPPSTGSISPYFNRPSYIRESITIKVRLKTADTTYVCAVMQTVADGPGTLFPTVTSEPKSRFFFPSPTRARDSGTGDLMKINCVTCVSDDDNNEIACRLPSCQTQLHRISRRGHVEHHRRIRGSGDVVI